jgi:hypothetical protein
MLLEQHTGAFRLLSRIEFLPEDRRHSLRVDNSPLTIAYGDPVFRAQGLASDQFGDAVRFFDLTPREAHHLLCDCHYGRAATPQMVAGRARSRARPQAELRRGVADSSQRRACAVAALRFNGSAFARRVTRYESCCARALHVRRKRCGMIRPDEIKKGMEVVGSDGEHVGIIDGVEDDGEIRLAKSDSKDGLHHFLPLANVEHVDDRVHLNRTSIRAMAEWR